MLELCLNKFQGLVFSPDQYSVITGPSSETGDARHPNQYSSQWANCVSLAQSLINGTIPNSALGTQCYHVGKNTPYPSSAVESTKIQIPAGTGNKFFHKQSSL